MSELHFPVPALADQMVRLRPWREADVADGLMAFSDPVVQRFSWPQQGPFTTEDACAYFTGQESARRRGDEVQFALVEPGDDKEVLGGASFYALNRERGTAALGYWLAPQARGRGVASHAVRLLATWGFARVGLVRLELTCGPDNEASQRVAARCGFVLEGVMRSHLAFKGGRRDTMLFSLLPGELR